MFLFFYIKISASCLSYCSYLNDIVNAVAHSTQETRKMAKKDRVSFVVTKIDEIEKVAVGMITKLLHQHM